MAVKEPNNIPIELDEVEVEIIASFGLLIDCVTKRRTQILSQYRDRREERRAAVESRKETLQQLSESKLDLQGKMKNNELHSMLEKMVDDIDAKMKLLELEDANANNEKLLFEYDVKDLEKNISQFGKLNDNSSQQESTQGVITCALYDYKAGEDDEVSFNPEDRMEILEVVSDGWCIGRNLESGQAGLLPSNYVAPFEGMEKTKEENENILELPPEMDNWKIEGSNLELMEELNRGDFRILFKGILKKGSSDQHVTVKKSISGSITDQKQLLQEANKLKLFRHPNIVEFIGVSIHDGGICIILELMSGGDFLTFLRNMTMDEKKHVLSEMVLGVAKGMSYLSSKDCVHRDLAARSCVIGENRSVKIGSFRMARFKNELDEEHKRDQSGAIPFKWSAPEVFGNRLSTCQSDVWSFGILLWETFSYGSIPYPGMDIKTVLLRVSIGDRLLAPDGTPPDIYKLMQNCWEHRPQDRPQFPKIVKSLESITQKLRKQNI